MSHQELPPIKLVYDTTFVSQNLNISHKLLKADTLTWTRYTPYWKLFLLPREAMTSIFHLSNSSKAINSLFTNISVICDGVCLFKYNFNPS